MSATHKDARAYRHAILDDIPNKPQRRGGHRRDLVARRRGLNLIDTEVRVKPSARDGNHDLVPIEAHGHSAESWRVLRILE